jgi:hypothetical protein
MPLTTVDQGLLSTNAQYTGFKNRMINGDMTIAQRSVGPVTNSVAGGSLTYDTVDRFGYWAQNSGVFSTQQSSIAPTGFKNSVLLTSLASTSITSGSYYAYAQRIEGFNIADLNWGTANAKTVTFSFWIRSSLTGTFNGYIFNSGYSYNYPFTYTISAANTWEQKTITIAGPTAGTWLTTNGIGIEIGLTLGAGSLYQATANTWGTTNYSLGSSGTTNFVSTNGATLYTTGWQLEVGSTATSFDVLPYGTELALCQRYYERRNASEEGTSFANCAIYSGRCYAVLNYSVTKRTPPTLTNSTGNFTIVTNAFNQTATAPDEFFAPSVSNGRLRFPSSGSFTNGQAGWVSADSASTWIAFSAEL